MKIKINCLIVFFVTFSIQGMSQWSNTSDNSTTGNLLLGTSNSSERLIMGKVGGGGSTLNWPHTYLGFNLWRSGSNWLRNSDGSNNGGSSIIADPFGGLSIITFSSTGSSNLSNITDQQINENTRLYINGGGAVGIGTRNPAAKLDIVDQSIPSSLRISGKSDGMSSSMLELSNVDNLNLWFMRRSTAPGQEDNLDFLRFNSSLASWLSVLTLKLDGKVGMGLVIPKSDLHIQAKNANVSSRINFGFTPNIAQVLSWPIGYQGFNIHLDEHSGNWVRDPDGTNNGGALIMADIFGGLRFSTFGSSGNSQASVTSNDVVTSTKLYIKSDGKIGIGLSHADKMNNPTGSNVNHVLFVKGGILAEEVNVMLYSNWPDYVFKKGYNLMPLSEVDQFISENHHLPGMPKAEFIEENGINVSEMIRLQQEKIEELSLYVIDLQRQLNVLSKDHK